MNRVVLWTGRWFAAILTLIYLSEYLNGGASNVSRMTIVVALVFSVLGVWQLYIGWQVTLASFDREISIAMWYQLGVSSLYFLVRWITIDKPRRAGIGETGSAG